MAFLAAAVAVLGLLLVVLLVTCAHLLARIMRLEAAERRRAVTEHEPGDALLHGERLPPDVARDLAWDRPANEPGVALLHVVSAGCATCQAVVDRLCREGHENGVTHRLVVGHEADRMLLPDACATRVVVSAALVRAVMGAGYALPVVLRIERGVVADIEGPIGRDRGSIDV